MTLMEQWQAVYADMRGKWTRHDWHGVRDACVDLEGIEIRMAEHGVEVPVPEQPAGKIRWPHDANGSPVEET